MNKILLIFLSLTIYWSAYGQYKNIKLDEANGEGYAPAEPSITINPDNPDNIVAAAILNKIYVTHDGGQTWSKQEVESEYGVFGDPVLTADKKGNFYFFHLSDPAGKGWQDDGLLDRIVCQVSKDGGDTWEDAGYYGLNHPKDQDKEWAIFDPSSKNLYTAWTQFDKYKSAESDHFSNILFSKSATGKKWTAPIQLNKEAGNCLDDDGTVSGAMPAVGPDGQIYVVWAHNEKIYLDRSWDKGKVWLRSDLEAAKQPGGWTFDIPGLGRANGLPFIDVDVSKSVVRGTVYLLWTDQRNGENDTDVWIKKTTNHGDTWTSPVRVNDDDPGKHQFMASMTIDQTTGILYILYYDRRAYDDLQTDVYLAYSIDGGNKFTNVKISETPFVPDEEHFFGDYIDISAHKGIISPVWTRMDNGKTSIWTSVIKQDDLVKIEDKLTR
ncbi:MAG: glycoside hydrolase [Cyclobacteriaceae bacterium]|nr:glycoside hydrolase [Cyclobacteriaceae bacterium]